MNAFGFRSFLNWSMSVGRLFGIPIRLHITILFFLLPALTQRALGLGVALEFSLGIVLSILVHELGHALAAKRYRMTGLSIMLHGFGGFAVSSGYRTPRQALVIVLAGPGATFALGLFLLAVGSLGLGSAPPGSEASLQFWIVHALGRLNVVLGFLNLIPVLPWDGGQALQAILAHRVSEIKAVRAAAHAGLLVAPPLLLYGWFSGEGFFGLFGLVGLLTCYSTLVQTGGVRFGEMFDGRRQRKETEAVRKRKAARQGEFMDEVKMREKEREEKERLRRIFEASDIDV